MSALPCHSFKIKILVVDDEKDITDLLVRHFGFLGYDIVGINNPLEAVKMVEEGNFNIVVTDIVMPGLDGLELLHRIKSNNGDVQVIIITGYVTMHNILRAMRLGAETVFFKPFHDLDKLEDAIKSCIAKIQMWQDILKELTALGRMEKADD